MVFQRWREPRRVGAVDRHRPSARPRMRRQARWFGHDRRHTARFATTRSPCGGAATIASWAASARR